MGSEGAMTRKLYEQRYGDYILVALLFGVSITALPEYIQQILAEYYDDKAHSGWFLSTGVFWLACWGFFVFRRPQVLRFLQWRYGGLITLGVMMSARGLRSFLIEDPFFLMFFGWVIGLLGGMVVIWVLFNYKTWVRWFIRSSWVKRHFGFVCFAIFTSLFVLLVIHLNGWKDEKTRDWWRTHKVDVVPYYEGTYFDQIWDEVMVCHDHHKRWKMDTWLFVDCASESTNTSSEGERKTDNPVSVEGLPKIIILGGSLAFGMGDIDEATIASFLSRLLEAAGEPHHVLNFSVIAGNSIQEKSVLERYLRQGGSLGHSDRVVSISFLNDALSTWGNREAGLSMFDAELRTVFFPPVDRLGYWLGKSGKLWKRSGFLRGVFYLLSDKDFPVEGEELTESQLKTLAADAASVFLTNLRLMRHLVVGEGAKLSVYLQPTIWHRGEESMSAREKIMGAPNTPRKRMILRAYEEVRANPDWVACPQCHDLSWLFYGDERPTFVDHWHVAGSANEKMAWMIFQDIMDDLAGSSGE